MVILNDKRAIALARLPGEIRDAVRQFERLTGLTAVTTLGSASVDERTKALPLPSLHPRCAERVRKGGRQRRCAVEWQHHLRSAVRMRGSRIHVCPLGLRCAGVPIAFGNRLLGLAKLVCDPAIPEKRFRTLVGLLETLIARPCQNLEILLLREEVHTLHVSMNRLRRATRPDWGGGSATNRSTTRNAENDSKGKAQELICQVLSYLDQHYTESGLSLKQTANAMDRNEKYLAHFFVQQIGQRMHAYITALRVRRSCELLLQTTQTIEQVALCSGFAHVAQLRQSFRRVVGVTPSEYRTIFAAGTEPSSRRPPCEFEKPFALKV